MLRYTGHPFVDVGVATICAMSNKKRPSDVTHEDLIDVAERLKAYYLYHPAMNHYTRVLFPNAAFTQPSMTAADKVAYADQNILGFQQDRLAEEGDACCTFFQELAAYRKADRTSLPLLTGRETINFSPMGIPGLSVSGLALLAIHAMPAGTFKCGDLLIFHQMGDLNDSSAHAMMQRLANRAWKRNLGNINLLINVDDSKMPSYGGAFRTRYVDEIIHAREEIRERNVNMYHITGYYFTNYATSPSIEILHLDNAVLDFLNVAQQDASDAWRRVIRRGWQTIKGEKELPTNFDTGTRRNHVYERLFELPKQSLNFIHMLKPTQGGSWELIEIFLRKVMLMEQRRIDLIRDMGDRLAEFAVTHTNQPLSFYHRFSRAKGYGEMLAVLRSASETLIKQNVLLFTYDDFVRVFEDGKDERKFWRINRELIAIRMMEQLHHNNVQITEEDLPTDFTTDTIEDEEN